MCAIGRMGIVRFTSSCLPARLAWAATVWILLGLCTSPAGSQTVAESDSSVLVLRLEASQPVYSVDDSILIRLTLRNTLSDSIALRSAPLLGLVQLNVYDSMGIELKRGLGALAGYFSSGPPTWSLGPWRQTSMKGPDGRYWISLDDFGYDLHAPGRYTIIATPPPVLIPPTPANTVNPSRIVVTVQRSRWPSRFLLAVLLVTAMLVLVGARAAMKR
jgi:hypothetical protein